MRKKLVIFKFRCRVYMFYFVSEYLFLFWFQWPTDCNWTRHTIGLINYNEKQLIYMGANVIATKIMLGQLFNTQFGD